MKQGAKLIFRLSARYPGCCYLADGIWIYHWENAEKGEEPRPSSCPSGLGQSSRHQIVQTPTENIKNTNKMK